MHDTVNGHVICNLQCKLNIQKTYTTTELTDTCMFCL